MVVNYARMFMALCTDMNEDDSGLFDIRKYVWVDEDHVAAALQATKGFAHTKGGISEDCPACLNMLIGHNYGKQLLMSNVLSMASILNFPADLDFEVVSVDENHVTIIIGERVIRAPIKKVYTQDADLMEEMAMMVAAFDMMEYSDADLQRLIEDIKGLDEL